MVAKKKTTRKKIAKKTTGKTSSKKKVAKVAKKAARSVKKAAKKSTKKAVAGKPRGAAGKKKTAKKTVRKKTAVKKAAKPTPRRRKSSSRADRKAMATISGIAPIPPAEESVLDDGFLLDLTPEQLNSRKSPLSKKEIRQFRSILLEKRAELLGDVESIGKVSTSEGGNLSHMPVHMADIGSDAYEQEFNLGLLESERKLLREIEQALMRIDLGYYGICMLTGNPIERARLDIKPWARYCIEAVRRREKAGLL